MSHEITVELSEPMYNKLRRTAELSRQPLDTIIEQSLAHSLSPLLDDIPPEYQAEVYPLLLMSVEELQEEARRRFPSEQWADYEILLEKKKVASLSARERQRIDSLRREADILTFRKAYAAVLLKRRGYQVPLVEKENVGP